MAVDQQGLVRFSNGSEIAAVAAAEAAVRGRSVDLLCIDECPMISPQSIVTDAAFPTTAARPDARILVAGTATVASGVFYELCERGRVGSEHVARSLWVSTLVGGECDAPWCSASQVAADRELMYSDRFAAEYLGVFGSGSDRLYPRINVTPQSGLPGHPFNPVSRGDATIYV